MEIKLDQFLEVYKRIYISNPSKTAPFAYWKMIELFKESNIYYLEDYETYYVIRDNHLISYFSDETTFHFSKEELNSLDCITVLKDIYETSEKDLNIFNKAIIEPLYFDKRNKIETKLDDKYEIVDFDFKNDMHLLNASEIINEDLGDFFKSDNIRKMATFPSFNQGLCFFIKDTTNEELIGVSISTYCKEVDEVDIDWMYIRKNYHRQGIGSFMINETVRRSKDAKIIRVSGKNEFYKKCGFIAEELWVWAAKPGYSFYAPAIQPNILD